MKSAQCSKDGLQRKRLTDSQKVLPSQAALTNNPVMQASNSGTSFAEKQDIRTCDTPAHCLPPIIQRSNTTQLNFASAVQNSQTRAVNHATIESVSTKAMQHCSQHLPTHMHNAHSYTEPVWPANLIVCACKSTEHNSDQVLMSWALQHVERMLLATPIISNVGCLAALKTTVTDHLSKMPLHATLECMASYLLAFTLLTGQAAKILLVTIWISLAMFATALQTTHSGTDRCQIRTLWLAQTTQCFAHTLWLLLMILRHAASNVHIIAAMYTGAVFTKTQHALIAYILIFQVTCAIMQMTPVIMLAVEQTIQLMMPPNTRHHRNFAHPKTQGRQILDTHEVHPQKAATVQAFVLLSYVHTKLYQLHMWKRHVIYSVKAPMCHRAHPNMKYTHTNNRSDYKQEKRRQAECQEDSERNKCAANEPADSTEYGGGTGSTLNTLWDKLRVGKNKTQQSTALDIFDPKGREWLSVHQISSCLTLLPHTKYRHAVHQAATGSAHMVCNITSLEKLFCEAPQCPLPADADFTKVLADSCSTEGPCPSTVTCDDLHFRNICINAKTSTIDFVDPFLHGFPTEVIKQVQDFYDRHDGKGKWTYKMWSHKLQTDCYICGIWSIWILETWMQYWSQSNTTETFERFCKRQAAGLTGNGLRTHFYNVLKEGCRKTANGGSALDVARERSLQRRPTSKQISLVDSPHKSDNAARPSAPGRQQQAADSLNSKTVNKEIGLQQQPVDCTDNTGLNTSAASENERDTQFLNNTCKPFPSTGKQLLDSREVQKCILYLQYTYYNQAKHLSKLGLTHEVVPTPQMQICFSEAGSTAPLDSRAEISQTFRDSLQRSGPSPVVVFSDNNHFQIVWMNAVSKMVTLFDPFGNGFPKSMAYTVKAFLDKDSTGSWKYRTWTQRLQTDTWNCGIWARWVTERWMQYWTEEDGKQPFDCWLKRHTCPVPNIQQLRQQYHDMISAALVICSGGQSEMDKI